MNVVFERSEEVAKNIKTLWFRPERPVQYIAGQFTELYLPHDNTDDRGIRRWFTLSSSPTEELLGITTKFAPHGGSTFKQQLAGLQPGTALKLADPMGDFVLPKDSAIPLMFVAAGLGITPVRSMIKWLTDKGEQRDVQLLYAAHSPEELAFLPLLAHHKVTTFVTNETPDYLGNIGSLNLDHILELAQANDNSLIYLSGPEQFVETTIKELKAKDIASYRLIGDYFPGYQQF